MDLTVRKSNRHPVRRFRMLHRPLCGCVCAGMTFMAATTVVAAPGIDDTWTGAAGNHLWADPKNWSAGVPGALDFASFNLPIGQQQIDLGGATQFARIIDFNVGGWTLGNGTLATTNINSNNGQVQIIANVTASAGTKVLYLTGARNGSLYDRLRIDGVIFGGGFDVLADTSLLGANTYTGRTISTDGAILDGNGSILQSSSLQLSGGGIVLRNYDTNLGNRVNDAAPILLDNGSFQLTGNAITATSERVGTITFQSGGGVVQVGDAAMPITLTAAGLAHTPGGIGVLNLVPIAHQKLLLDSVALIGPGDAPKHQGIIPFVFMDRALGYSKAGPEFATYDTTPDPNDPGHVIGVRALNLTTEYAAAIPTSGTPANVHVPNPQTLGIDATINSLFVDGNLLTVNAGLTVNSGAIRLSAGTIAGTGTLVVPGEAILIGTGTIAVPIHASALTVGGNVKLTQPNPITGDTYIEYRAEVQSAGVFGSTANKVHLAGPGSELKLSGAPTLELGNDIEIGGQYLMPLPHYLVQNQAQPTIISVQPGTIATLTGHLSGQGTLQVNPTSLGGVLRLNGDGDFGFLSLNNFSKSSVEVNGTLRALPGGFIQINGRLRGNGTIHGTINGGDISAGPDGGIGRLTTDFFTTATGSIKLTADLAGTQPGTNYDQLVVLNGVDFRPNSRARLAVNLLFTPTAGDRFTIIDNQSALKVNGTFDSLPEGASFLANGVPLSISYIGGDGNDVVLTAIPEPGGAFVVFVGALGLLRRRSRAACVFRMDIPGKMVLR